MIFFGTLYYIMYSPYCQKTQKCPIFSTKSVPKMSQKCPKFVLVFVRVYKAKYVLYNILINSLTFRSKAYESR